MSENRTEASKLPYERDYRNYVKVEKKLDKDTHKLCKNNWVTSDPLRYTQLVLLLSFNSGGTSETLVVSDCVPRFRSSHNDS